MLRTLLPPAWPEALSPIDRDAAVRGATLFQAQCAGCHQPLARDDLETPIRAQMSRFAFDAPPPGPGRVNIPPGTDPVMACNAFNYRAASGWLEGYSAIGPEGSGVAFLTVIVRNSLIGDWRQVLHLAFTIFIGHEPRLEPQLEGVPRPPVASAAYPACPNAIASASTAPGGAGRPHPRLQGAAADRHLGDRALPPQRLGADASRSAAAAGGAAGKLPCRLAPVRSGAGRLRHRPLGRE